MRAERETAALHAKLLEVQAELAEVQRDKEQQQVRTRASRHVRRRECACVEA